jgi:hypothetical protein
VGSVGAVEEVGWIGEEFADLLEEAKEIGKGVEMGG